MRTERQRQFDANRMDQINPNPNMENDAVRNVIEQQEAQIAALQARIEQMNIERHQQQVQPAANNQQLTLSADQFLNYVNKLQKFNGRDEFTVQEFISSVERALQLCQNAPGLRDFAVEIIINEKIQGDAKRCIQRLGDTNNWQEIKRELKLHFRPRYDYADLLNQCRTIKVSTLRELFDSVREVNYKLNQLYEFDDEKPPTYHPRNNDRYLLDIINSKVHDFVRGNIPENSTVIEVYNKLEKLRLLDNEEAVDHKSRKYNKPNKNFNLYKYEGVNKNSNTIAKNSSNFNGKNNSNRPNQNINNFRDKQGNNKDFSQTNYSKKYNNSNNFYHNNNQHRQQNSGYYRNRQNFNYNQQRQNSVKINNSNPPVEPMEIGNLCTNNDVNFCKVQNPESPS